MDYGSHTTIGARCFANFGLVALDVAKIVIGNDVQIGPNVQLLTPTHPLEPEPRRAGTVVVRDLPANVVAVGNPARILRHLDPESAVQLGAERCADVDDAAT